MDIETAPTMAHVWTLWDQHVGLNQIMAPGYVLCWAAKWVGEPRIFFGSVQHNKAKKMLKGIHALLTMADAVITWNGVDFDTPTLNREFIEHGFDPPAPYAQIDLMRVAKKRFKFISNKLEYVARDLKCGKKLKHEGHELWVKCLDGQRKAWKTMRAYNINDTVILEALYNKFLPWVPNHPHVGLREGNPGACPSCGGTQLQSRGWGYTKLGKYQRFACKNCHTWTRSGKRLMVATHAQVVP